MRYDATSTARPPPLGCKSEILSPKIIRKPEVHANMRRLGHAFCAEVWGGMWVNVILKSIPTGKPRLFAQ